MTTTTSSRTAADDDRRCFICLDDALESGEPLLSDVCACKSAVHERCLNELLNARHKQHEASDEVDLTCSVCRETYRLRAQVKRKAPSPLFDLSLVKRWNCILGVVMILGFAVVFAAYSRQILSDAYLLIAGIVCFFAGFMIICWAICVPQIQAETEEEAKSTVEISDIGGSALSASSASVDLEAAPAAPPSRSTTSNSLVADGAPSAAPAPAPASELPVGEAVEGQRDSFTQTTQQRDSFSQTTPAAPASE